MLARAYALDSSLDTKYGDAAVALTLSWPTRRSAWPISRSRTGGP
jgi:hypothetical protein